MQVAFVLLVSVAAVLAGEYDVKDRYYAPGFQHVAGGIASAYRNDARQVAVNHVAEHYGSGTGTARFVGVPGTGNNFGYNHHGHGYAGNGGYGYNHGNNYGY